MAGRDGAGRASACRAVSLAGWAESVAGRAESAAEQPESAADLRLYPLEKKTAGKGACS